MSGTTSKGTALITGASSGLGAIYADRLARLGYHLILVSRNATRMRVIADRLVDECAISIGIIAADLTRADDLAEVETELRANTDITMLVNNAGLGSTAPFLSADIATMERMIALNITAPTRLAYAATSAFGRGGAAPLSTSRPSSPSLRSWSTASMAAPKPSFWRSPARCIMNSPTKEFAFRPSCREPPRPSSGFTRAQRWNSCRKPSSCRRMTSSMRRLPGWTKESCSRFRPCRTWMIGDRSKMRATPCCRTSR